MTEYKGNNAESRGSNGFNSLFAKSVDIKAARAKRFATKFPPLIIRSSIIVLIFLMFPKIVRAGQDITTNFDIAGNAYGNSNAPYYDCQPGTNCVVEAIEPNGNIFRITGGAIGGYAVGGYGDDSSANNNKVILSAGNIAQHLYGGFVVAQSPHNSPLTANGNSLELTGGTVGFSITGANAYASAQVLETNIFANFNSVNIDVTSSLTDISNIYGADIINAGIGFASAEGNTVNIVNGIIKLLYSNIAGASVYSSYGDSTAIRNKVNISGGNIGVDISSSGLRAIYGGYASSFNSSGTAVAYFNEVNISAGILKGRSGFAIYGGYGLSPNGGPLHVSAMGNIVNISGGEVNGDVFGGTGASASLSRAGVATGNFVNVSGGLINGSVFGGEGYHAYPSGVATATGNEVTISGAPTFGANSEIYGGIAHGKGDDVTGNTLNFLTSGIAVKGLYNFARLNFLLPANAANGATILTVTDRAEVTYATVEVAVAGASSPLGPGDEFILIDATVLDGAPLNSQTSGFGARGVSLVYEFELLQSGNQLKAVVRKAAVNERVKALSEGFVAALGLIARGSDLVEGQGLASATQAVARGASPQGANWVPFAALSANRERLETGSHVDSSGFAVVAGIVKGFTFGSARLAIGPFFEYGHGAYDSYNSFAASPAVHGDGRANYAGGGALARLELPHGPGALHFELSGRIGRLRNEYHSADLTSLTGIAASYDYSGAYYGYHFGTGYLWNVSEKTSLDLSAKYFWTRQEGKEAVLATGEKASFDAAESSRLRLGARLARDFSDKARAYVGAAWERELAGEARAYYWGLPVKAPSLKGDAGIGEVGVTLSPTDGGGFSLDFGVQGYVGQRRGATGSLRLQFEF